MATPNSTEEIIRMFNAIVRREAPRNSALTSDAWALLDSALTPRAEEIMAAKGEDRDKLFQDSAAALQQAAREASSQIDPIRGEGRYARFRAERVKGGPALEVGRGEMSRLLKDFGPIPPFC